MSLRLTAISLYLRFRVKRKLARIKEPVKARAMFERVAERMLRRPKDANVIEDRVEGPGGQIAVDWVSRGRPDRHAVLLYLHGGAYLMGSTMTHRGLIAALAETTGARVMAPNYRLAPETRWPGAVEDVLACYRSLLASGYAPERIAFGGDSAGGGLAMALLVAAREAGLPDPACLVLFSPWVDLTLSHKSLKRNARSDPMLPASRVEEVRDYYVSAEDAAAPTASPLFADLVSPPPTLIQASRIELLEDEAGALAEKLRASGGEVRLEWFRKAPHAWQIFAGMMPEADQALARAGAFVAAKIGAQGCEGAE